MNDEELRRRFRELKALDAKRAPSFDKLTAKRPRRIPKLVVLTPVLAAAAGIIVWCGGSMNAKQAAPIALDVPPPAATIRVGAPAALPLDFLLETTPIRVHLDVSGEGLP